MKSSFLPKAILHMDADSFFASVEISKNPKLRGHPVVTGQERGIATSMSPEAKKIGITRGMPVFMIRKEFPQAVVVHSDYEAYAMYSKRMFEVVRRYTDIVEEYSIDECFADITEYAITNKISYDEILRNIQDEIERELHISVSLGCGPTKVLAKVGSKWNKPHGVTVISKDKIPEFLSKVPIGNIWGIGRSSTKMLLQKRINTALDFALFPKERLGVFVRPLIDIWNELNGREVLLINSDAEKPKSIARTLSFNPYKTKKSELFTELVRHTENACIKARSHALAVSHITWFIKTSEYRYQSFDITLERPTNTPSLIVDKIWDQLKDHQTTGHKYKTTGVVFSSLCEENSIQNDLFNFHGEVKKAEKIFSVIDTLAQKYGRHMVHLASSLKPHTSDKKNFTEERIQLNFFNNIKKTGKKLSIPYLGETR